MVNVNFVSTVLPPPPRVILLFGKSNVIDGIFQNPPDAERLKEVSPNRVSFEGKI